MNNILEKVAYLSPTDLMLYSSLAGAGTFGGLRLLTDALQKVNPQKVPRNTVELMEPETPEPELLPESSPMKAANELLNEEAVQSLQGNNSSWLPKLLATAVGAPVGFLGTKGIYDMYRGNQEQKKTEQAKQEYLSQLALANKLKTASLPCTDAFCEAVAEELQKEANDVNDQLADSPLVKDLVAGQYKGNLSQALKSGWNSLTLNSLDHGTNAALLVGLLGGGATLGGLLHANKSKREKELRAPYPTGVSYGK